MIHTSLLENLCQYIRDNHNEIVSNPELIKSVWRKAGEISVFENDSREESLLLLQTLVKYGIYDFPFWLQRDVLIPLFEKNASESQKEKYECVLCKNNWG